MKPKIGLVTLAVTDFARALRFYRDGLGFPTHGYVEGEEIVFFQLEGTWLALYPRDKLAEDATVNPAGSGFSGVTLAHNAGSTGEVDAVFELAVAAGAAPLKPPHDTFWGGYSGYFKDPDGHLWEVAWNPFFDLT